MDTILIVDDDNDFRRSLKLVFEMEGYEVLEACNGADAIDSFKAQDPDLVIMDMNMPGMNGIATIKELKHIDPSVPMVILTAYGTIPDAVRAMQDGAINFKQKTDTIEDLIAVVQEAIKSSYKGNLSAREIEILFWLTEGKSNQDIGDILNIAESTVKAHVKHLYKKLDVSSRVQAMQAAIKMGIIKPDKR